MRRITGVLLLCAAWACSAPKAPKIGVSVATMQEPVYSFMRQAMLEKSAAEHVDLLWVSAENSEAKQSADVDGFVAQGVDVIILHAVNTGTAAGLVEKAAAAGIPVIAMDRLPAGAGVSLFVTADSRRVGQLQAKYLAERLGGKGGVVILEGEAGNSVARDITAGNLETLAGYPGITVLARRAQKNWARDLARAAAEDAFARFPGQVQGILANNSGMAMGALEAAEGASPPRAVLVVGADADLDACQAVAAGRLAADVDKMPTEIGRAAFEAAQRLIARRPLERDAVLKDGGASVPVKLTPVRLLTKDDVKPAMEYRWGRL